MSDQNVRHQAIAEIRARQEAKAKSDKIELLALALTSTTVSVTLLVKASRAAKRGDYTKATYYAVLWVGHTNNSNTAIYRKLDEVRPRPN